MAEATSHRLSFLARRAGRNRACFGLVAVNVSGTLTASKPEVKRTSRTICCPRTRRTSETFRNMLQCSDGRPGSSAYDRALAHDDPRDRRPGGRLDRDRLAGPQRPRRRLGRDARARPAGHPRARLHGEPQRAQPLGRAHRAVGVLGAARLPGVLLGDLSPAPPRRSTSRTCASSSRRPGTSTTARSRCSTG